MPRCIAAIVSTRSAPRAAARREAGATAIEYSLMICMVALGIIALAAILGGVVSDWFGDMATRV